MARKLRLRPVKGVRCPRCGGPLYNSMIPEYTFQCLECDEDFYFIEVDTSNKNYHAQPTLLKKLRCGIYKKLETIF